LASTVHALNPRDSRRWLLRLLSIVVGLVGVAGAFVSFASPSTAVLIPLIATASIVSVVTFVSFGAAWFWWRGFGPGSPGERRESLVDWLGGVFGGPSMSFGAGVLLLHVVASLATAGLFAAWNVGTPMIAMGGWFIILLVAVCFWRCANGAP